LHNINNNENISFCQMTTNIDSFFCCLTDIFSLGEHIHFLSTKKMAVNKCPILCKVISLFSGMIHDTCA